MRISSLLTDGYEFFRGSADEFYGYAGGACRGWIADKGAYLTIHGDIHIGNSGTCWVSDGVAAPELRRHRERAQSDWSAPGHRLIIATVFAKLGGV